MASLLRPLALFCVLVAQTSVAEILSPVTSFLFHDSVAGDKEGANVVSSVVSFQFQERIGKSEAISQITSYQFPDSLPEESLRFEKSFPLSVFYLGENLPLQVVQTTRKPKITEIPSQVQVPGKVVPTTDPNGPEHEKITVVLTHGWVRSWLPSDEAGTKGWPRQFKEVLVSKKLAEKANIFPWDWEIAAFGAVPPIWKTLEQGVQLGRFLEARLGTDYRRPIHFIGHSLGTLVNARAADYLHNRGFDPNLTQITLLDQAEIAEVFSPDKHWPIPKKAFYIESYHSLFGAIQLLRDRYEAAHTVLFTISGVPLASQHDYAWRWYLKTIENPEVAPIGFRQSYLGGAFPHTPPPANGTVFLQRWPESEFEFNIVPSDHGIDWPTLPEIGRAAYEIVDRSIISPVSFVVGAIESLGNNLIGWRSQSPSIHDSQLHVRLNPSPSVEFQQRGIALQRKSENSVEGAYVWLPVLVPTNAIGFSFTFSPLVVGDSGRIDAAIEGTNIFSNSLEGTNVQNSGFIDVSHWRGKLVQMLLGISGNVTSNDVVEISQLSFHPLIMPRMQIAVLEGFAQITWPTGPFPLRLESSHELLGDWMEIPFVPQGGSVAFARVSLGSKPQFFRLHLAE